MTTGGWKGQAALQEREELPGRCLLRSNGGLDAMDESCDQSGQLCVADPQCFLGSGGALGQRQP